MQKWADCSLTRSSRSRLSIPHSVDSTLTIPVFGRIEPYASSAYVCFDYPPQRRKSRSKPPLH